MPVPDFSPGEVLTSSVMDRVGLWHITTVTPTPANTIVVSNVFTSGFRDYLVICTPIGVVAGSDITLQLRTGAFPAVTAYYMTNLFVEGTSVTSSGENNVGSWRAMNLGAAGNPTFNSLKFDVYGPQVASHTRYQVNGGGWSGSQVRYRSAVGFQGESISFDGFQLNASSNISATITVYGYNKGQ
jgi:hypothetical protein